MKRVKKWTDYSPIIPKIRWTKKQATVNYLMAAKSMIDEAIKANTPTKRKPS